MWVLDFVGVKPSASQDEINKAYRKKGKILHPDKVKQSVIASKAKPTTKVKPGQAKKKPGVHVSKGPTDREIRNAIKEASDRFARLGLIAGILRGPGRERYDHFLQNGFPKWRGTGYYYARFRPGLGSVLIGLFVFAGGLAHYGALILGWKRQREFVDRYIRQARRAAWGDEVGIKGIPGVDGTSNVPLPASANAQEDGNMILNRRQKRMQERESKKGKENKSSKFARRSGTSTPLETGSAEGPQGERKRVQAENGKILLVDSVGNVFLEEETDEGEKGEYLLDPNEITKPTFRDTVLFRLPIWMYKTGKGRILGLRGSAQDKASEPAEEEGSSSTDEDEEALAKAKHAGNGMARRQGKRNGKVR